MKILGMIWRSLRRGYQTLLFPARPKVTPRFRGLVKFDPEFCTGCAVCKMRCTSRAIDFKTGKGEFTWSYNPGQCTFCGRCVEGCTEHAAKAGHPEHALSQEEACPPVYLEHGELSTSYTVARKPPAAKAAAAPKPPADAAASTAAATPNPATGGAQ
jgi:formate hydrogenlyase subunit 6/NADH:ubiquinone oxidoreductase subunit I